MQFDYMREFLDLAGTLSFTRSAANLAITQPTLSRHIAELERQVGASLFDRTTSSVRLTRAGKTLYETASAMQVRYDEALSQIRDAARTKHHTVRCGGSPFHAFTCRTYAWLEARAMALDLPVRFEFGKMRAFAAESPSVYSVDLLRSGDLDIVVEPLPDDSALLEEFDSFTVGREPFVVIVSSENPLAFRKSLRLDDLAGYEALTLAVYQHCPDLMTYPYRAHDIDMRNFRTVFIGDLLEIAEHIGGMRDNQVVLMQEGFYRSFAFGAGSMGQTVLLPMHDERLEVKFRAFVHKENRSAGAQTARELLAALEEEVVTPTPRHSA